VPTEPLDATQLTAETGIDLTELPPVATPDELARILKTTPAALAQERYRRVGIPYVKWGSRIRYLRADVARYLADNRRQGTTAPADR
jgi:hypothetical protein